MKKSLLLTAGIFFVGNNLFFVVETQYIVSLVRNDMPCNLGDAKYCVSTWNKKNFRCRDTILYVSAKCDVSLYTRFACMWETQNIASLRRI